MKVFIWRIILLLLLLGAIVGCKKQKVSDMYYFGFVNNTGNNVSLLSCNLGKAILHEPELMDGGSATEGPYPPPIPDQIKLCWSQANTNFEVIVSLGERVPTHFRDGTIYVRLRNGGKVVVELDHFSHQ